MVNIMIWFLKEAYFPFDTKKKYNNKVSDRVNANTTPPPRNIALC